MPKHPPVFTVGYIKELNGVGRQASHPIVSNARHVSSHAAGIFGVWRRAQGGDPLSLLQRSADVLSGMPPLGAHIQGRHLWKKLPDDEQKTYARQTAYAPGW